MALVFRVVEVFVPCISPSSEHERLVAAAQVIVDMVDPQEGETSSSKSLVERLEEAPRKIVDYLSTTSKNYIAHLLGIVKSYWPQHNVAPLSRGIASNCPDEDLLWYRDEVVPIAEAIIKNLAKWSSCNNPLICKDMCYLCKE